MFWQIYKSMEPLPVNGALLYAYSSLYTDAAAAVNYLNWAALMYVVSVHSGFALCSQMLSTLMKVAQRM